MCKPSSLGFRTVTRRSRFQKIPEYRDPHFRSGNGAHLRDADRFLENDLLLQPLRDFFRGKDETSKRRMMRTALVEAVTTDRVTTTEKVTEIFKLTPSQRQALGEDLSSAFDAGDAVLVQKVTTTKTESPDPIVVIKAHQILFSEDDNSTGDEDSGS